MPRLNSSEQRIGKKENERCENEGRRKEGNKERSTVVDETGLIVFQRMDGS
jgi:hypothetical protein